MFLFSYLIIMMVVTNAVRILPVLLLRRPIRNRFVRSFLYYVPYVTLAVMTVPAIINSTANPFAGIAALLVGCAAAWCGWGLFPVSLACCASVLLYRLFTAF